MAIPIGDDNRDRRITPIVNYLLIAINFFVFIFWQELGSDTYFTFAFVTVPQEILTATDIITRSQLMTDPVTGQTFEMPGLQLTPIPVYLTLVTSQFMHGGIAHLTGNMLYLWIFGDNIEDRMGHFRYLLFYLLCGILAGLTHVFVVYFLGQDTLIPALGASGAISGVLGAYIVLHPKRRIYIWFFLFTAAVPALIVVGLWFLFQVMNGLGTLGGEESSGIAYGAHIGGFIFGLLLVRWFVRKSYAYREDGR